jgi:Mg2+/Co2+ transporter CorC
MADLHELLGQMHEELIEQVLDDLRNGDRKARSEALALLKQSNIQAVAQEGSTLSKLAGKLDFSSMEEKVIEFKRPPLAG